MNSPHQAGKKTSFTQRPLQHHNLLPATKDTDDPPVFVARSHYQERKSGATISSFGRKKKKPKGTTAAK
jgi:hypothetical protein